MDASVSVPSSIALVVPVYNERESLTELHRQITAVADGGVPIREIVFVDDGSKDGSWDVIKTLSAADPRVRGLRLRRNFGKAGALQAGFDHLGTADVVFTLDADLQDDPAEIPGFLRKLDEGFDLVVGWKKIRHDPWHKVFPSRVFNGMVSRVTGVSLHDHNCGMKCYRRAVTREIRLYGEMHRFVPVLAAARGFRSAETVIQHRARQFGKSKYGVKRFLRGFLDLITVKYLVTYARRPMHLFGSLALLALLATACFAVLDQFATIRVSWITTSAATAGLLLFLAGLMAETAAYDRTTPPYSITDRCGSDGG